MRTQGRLTSIEACCDNGKQCPSNVSGPLRGSDAGSNPATVTTVVESIS
jgi:hypothetical protein